MGAAFIKVSCKDHENISSKTLLMIARCSSSDKVWQNARNFRRSFLAGEPHSTELLSSSDNWESHSSKISSLRLRSPLIFIASRKRSRPSTHFRKISARSKVRGGVRKIALE